MNFTLGAIYRHPNSDINRFNDLLDNTLSSITKNRDIKNCIVAGDINIDIARYYSFRPAEQYLDIMSQNAFLPCIQLPTRITDHSATLIDHIFLKQQKPMTDQEIICGNILSDITDHLPTFMLIYFPEKLPPKPRPKVRVYNKLNKEKFANSLKNIDFNTILQTQDANTAFDIFHGSFQNLFEKHFPLKTLSRQRSKDKPWMNRELHALRKQRDKYKIQYNKGLIEKHIYTTHRNLTRKKFREAEGNYFKNLFNREKDNTKEMWKHMRQTLNPRKYREKTPLNKLFIDGKSVNDDEAMAHGLNSHFCTVGKTLAEKLPTPNSSFKNFLRKRHQTQFKLESVSTNEVLDVIKSLQDKKSPGPDAINNKILKLSAEIIISPLTHIINLSLKHGTFPDKIKLAHVIPLFKKNDPTVCSNYRPISLLSCFHKLFEKIVKIQLTNYLNKHNIFYKYQFGFRKSHSTNLAIVEVIDKIYANLNQNNIGLGIFLDLKKAFDTVNHEILLYKLEHYGIKGNALKWFVSYLSNRRQCTKVNGKLSSEEAVECGVPQGSVLGPLLFILYINDMENALNFTKPKLFADDSNLFLFHKDIKTLFSNANKDLQSLSEWLIANKLSLSVGNDKDSRYTIFSPTKLPQTTVLPKLHVGDKEIPRATSVKYLGLHIDENLNFKCHIDQLKNKIKKYTSLFYAIRHKLPKNCLRVLYHSFIFNNIYYCAEIYGRTSPSNIKPLQKVQNSALRALQFRDRFYPTNEMHIDYNVLKVSDIIEYKIQKLIHFILYAPNFIPQPLHNLVRPKQNFHKYQTRTNDQLYVEREKRSIGKHQLKCNPSLQWNNLPHEVRHQPTHGEFKVAFYEWKISNYNKSTLNFATH